MNKDALLSESDVRAIVKLLGDNIAVDGDLNEKKTHLMTGLCRLIQADAWVWCQAAEMDPDKLPVYIGFIKGGFSETDFPLYLKVQTHPDMVWMTAPVSRELAELKRHITRTRRQVVTDEQFMNCEVNKQWRDCGYYPLLVSYRPLSDGIISGIGIYRNWKREPCTEREAKIAHILLSEVPWLHEHQSPEAVLAHVPKLPIRQRFALELLLQGHSRKTIADNMGISINTVAGYVKEIYRFFGVTSHAALINRFFLGDGGDKA